MSLKKRGALFVSAFALLAWAGPEKKPKNQGEFDIYTQTVKDNGNPARQVQDLDAWTRDYPDSDFADERSLFYLNAYNSLNQQAKAVDAGARLMGKDLNAAFSDPRQVLSVLYLTALNAQKIAGPNAEQIAAGQKAARQLLQFAPGYFTADKKPAATGEGDWTKAKNDVMAVGRAGLVYFAMLPGNRALAANPKDPANCAAAEAAYRQAAEAIPESVQIAYALAGALRCQQTVHPEKVPQAMFEYARAAALAPEQGGIADYLRNIYTQYHGSEEGLPELKQLALRSPLPPDGFTVKTAGQVDAEKRAELVRTNPQLGLWLSIRDQLTGSGGQQFFETQLKGAAVPKLKGTLVEARPACRPRELVVAVSDAKTGEVVLKLDVPLAGKPEVGGEIQWEGVPSDFQASPLVLTMGTDKARIENLKMAPCVRK